MGDKDLTTYYHFQDHAAFAFGIRMGSDVPQVML
jgi:hypothetical protein